MGSQRKVLGNQRPAEGMAYCGKVGKHPTVPVGHVRGQVA